MNIYLRRRDRKIPVPIICSLICFFSVSAYGGEDWFHEKQETICKQHKAPRHCDPKAPPPMGGQVNIFFFSRTDNKIFGHFSQGPCSPDTFELDGKSTTCEIFVKALQDKQSLCHECLDQSPTPEIGYLRRAQ